MSYFSNHSQSRFLANASSKDSNSANSQSNGPPPNIAGSGNKPRAPSSKHFSTSVISGDEKSGLKSPLIDTDIAGPTNGVNVRPLRNTYVRNV